MRHYDVANRTRNRFTGQVDVVPNDLWMFSVSARRRQGRLRRQLFRPAGVDVPDCSRFGADYRAAKRFRRRAPATTTSATRDCSDRDRRARVRKTIRCATGPPTRRARELLLDLRRRLRRIGANTEARLSYDYSYARRQLPLRRSSPAGRCHRPRSFRRSSTSCSSCTSTCRHRLSNRLAATVLVSLRAVPRLRLRVRSRRSSTASSSPARWCSDTSTARTPRNSVVFGV